MGTPQKCVSGSVYAADYYSVTNGLLRGDSAIFGRETPAALDGRRKTQKHAKRSLRWTGEVRRKSMQNTRCAGREKSDAQNRLPSPVSRLPSPVSRLPSPVSRLPFSVSRLFHILLIFHHLELGDQATVHFVRAVGQAQGAGGGEQAGEREVVRQTTATVHLHGSINNLLRHVGGDDFDLGNFAHGAHGTDFVDHPRRFEYQQARLFDVHAGVGDEVAVAT